MNIKNNCKTDDKKVLKESFQDLLYKFISEAKKTKEQTNSLPILDN